MNFYEKIVNFEHDNKLFVIATIIKKNGHCPQIPGSKIVITQNEEIFGTIGGGKLEFIVIKQARELLLNNQSSSLICEYILSKNNEYLSLSDIKNINSVKIDSMTCGGRLIIFYDVHNIKDVIYIFGGGHVGSSIYYFLNKLNFNIKIIDSRDITEIAKTVSNLNYTKDSFLNIIYDQKEFEKILFLPNAYFIIVTHSHEHDYNIFSYLYNNFERIMPRYIGVIASKVKSKTILLNLIKQYEYNENIFNKIYCPIGLKIGGTSPNDIALSIVSEIQMIKYRKTSIDNTIIHNRIKWRNL